jgi:hypothetical protein
MASAVTPTMLTSHEQEAALVQKLDEVEFVLDVITEKGYPPGRSSKVEGVIIYRSLRSVLQMGGLQLATQLDPEQWSLLCGQVKNQLNSEHADDSLVHPTIPQIFTACNNFCGNRYHLALKEKFAGMEPHIERLDITINLFVQVGGSIKTVVLPVVIERLRDLRTAIHRALGFLVNELRNLLDLHGFNVKLSGYCLGTDGQNLSVGYAEFRERILTVVTTGTGGYPLWRKHAAPQDIGAWSE